MSANEGNPLGGLGHEAAPPPHLKSRVTASLRERGLLRPRAARAWRWAVPASLAASAALFYAGVETGRRTPPPAAAVAAAAPQFVLFLYEDAGFQVGTEPRAFVAEYRDWGRRVRLEGRLVGAEKLAESARLVAAPGGQVEVGERDVVAAEGTLTGYFIITARDYAQAVDIARTHPHLRHGGRIAIRAIDPT